MRHPFISIGLSNGVNIKWLAEYRGTSVAITEKHYAHLAPSYVADTIRANFPTLGIAGDPTVVPMKR